MELLKTQANIKSGGLYLDSVAPHRTRVRPDSAKVVGTKNRLAQLVQELEEPL